jgi:hypothetical protein
MITTVYLLLAALTLGTPLPHVPLAPSTNALRIAVVGDTGEGSDRVARGIASFRNFCHRRAVRSGTASPLSERQS